jgi:hypothetical protein
MAESELAILFSQYLDPRIPDRRSLERQVAAAGLRLTSREPTQANLKPSIKAAQRLDGGSSCTCVMWSKTSCSGLNQLKCRVEALQLDAGVSGGKAPVSFDVMNIAVAEPSDIASAAVWSRVLANPQPHRCTRSAKAFFLRTVPQQGHV